MLPRSDYYKMPADPWISFKYCDLTKLIKIRLNPKIRERYKNWDGAVTLGQRAPEIDLKGPVNRVVRIETVGQLEIVGDHVPVRIP